MKKMMNSIVKMFLYIGIVYALLGITEESQDVFAKTKVKNVKVGEQVKIKNNFDDVRYRSNDETVAYADKKGVVTGKKEGTTSVTVRSEGEIIEKYTINVEGKEKKPSSIPVTFSEVSMQEVQEYDAITGNAIFKNIITNDAETGKIRKIIYYYAYNEIISELPETALMQENTEQNVETVRRVVTLTAKNIPSWSSTEAERGGEIQYNGSLSELELLKIEMYTGEALYIYNAEYDEYYLRWGTNDNKPPKITGLVKEKSYTGDGDVIRTYYSDMKNTYDFTQFVEAYDERDGKVKVKADTGKINWSKEGTYKIWFTAKDKDGNKAKSWAKVKVYHPGTSEDIADGILKRIISKSWSDERKARAIYSYIRGHMSYVNHTSHIAWPDAALRSFRYQTGDCYTYYAVSRLFLNRAGISNMMIKRYPTPGGRRHYWNLAYINGGWYHFDTTPRRGVNFCLLTDSQLWNAFGGYVFKFRLSYYPERADKRL